MTKPGGKAPPLLRDKHYQTPSAFTPESLLREARRQKGAALASVPPVCLLDPDADIVRQLRALGDAIIRAQRREIKEMQWLMEDIKENGVVTSDEAAQERAVPDFEGRL